MTSRASTSAGTPPSMAATVKVSAFDNAIGHDAVKKVARKMGRREPAPSIAPLQTKLVESESLQSLEFRVDLRTIDDADKRMRWR